MELFDLYTPERVLTGKSMVRGDRLPDGLWRLVVRIAVFGDDGRMLIQKRTDTKSFMPDKWDMSAAGSVVLGEDSRTAIIRETREEIGIDLADSDFRIISTMYMHRKNGSGIFEDIYIVRMTPELSGLTLQKEEVEAVRWADEKEIISLIQSGEFIPFRPEFIRFMFAVGTSEDMKVHL